MKRFVYTIDLKDDPEKIAEYRAYHQNVWDEVRTGMNAVGIIRCSIYLLGTRLVNILETEDDFNPATDFARYHEGRPRAKEWDEMMAAYQQPAPGAAPKEWWALMEPVFEYDAKRDV